MIGLFDSGHGGLTILHALARRFPAQSFLYLGDHANIPYGNRSSEDVIALTERGAARLFDEGCRLVVLACNTATAIAGRHIQQNWLPPINARLMQEGEYGRERPHNVLGIIAPTVEAATQTPWAITEPQYPQKYNTETIALFATRRTVASNVYPEEISKRCPKVKLISQTCPDLVSAIEHNAGDDELESLVKQYCEDVLAQTGGAHPDRAILGCTHYPLVEFLFRKFLPAGTKIFSQPAVVADSLEDYLTRHPYYAAGNRNGQPHIKLLTTGENISPGPWLTRYWPEGAPEFEKASI